MNRNNKNKTQNKQMHSTVVSDTTRDASHVSLSRTTVVASIIQPVLPPTPPPHPLPARKQTPFLPPRAYGSRARTGKIKKTDKKRLYTQYTVVCYYCCSVSSVRHSFLATRDHNNNTPLGVGCIMSQLLRCARIIVATYIHTVRGNGLVTN